MTILSPSGAFGFLLLLQQCLFSFSLRTSATTKNTNLRRLEEEEAPLQQSQPQQESILGYMPQSQEDITDIAALDLDQMAMEEIMVLNTADALQEALAIYVHGAHSQPYAILSLQSPLDPSLNVNVPAGTLVVGQAFGSGDAVYGRLLEPVQAGATELLVQYETSNTQENYVNCQVGSNPNPNVVGCFATAGSLTVGNPGDLLTLNLSYTYNVIDDNQNARTLQSLSTNARKTMYECTNNCPYEMYEKFYNYYGSFDYANEWILAAFNRGATSFANGNANFSTFDAGSRGLIESIRKGTVFLNVFMQVVKSAEEAMDYCQQENVEGAMASWDTAVAYYVGSLTKMSGGDDGYFLYSTAEKRCDNFGTCSPEAGAANVNVNVMEMFEAGQFSLSELDCNGATQAKDRLEELMPVGLIQGLLRDAYFVDKVDIVDDRADASGATYAAAVLPLVHSCSPDDAQIIYDSMGIVGQSDKPNFDAVKAAFERNYECMGISCADIGGLIDPSTGTYFEAAGPCDDSALAETTTPETNPPTQKETMESTPASSESAGTEGPIVVTTDEPATTCPPCASTDTNPDVTISRTAQECNDYLSQQLDLIPTRCECACFVDDQFAFCARPDLLYTGSGSMVGPCEVSASTTVAKETEAPFTGEIVTGNTTTTTPTATNETVTDDVLTAVGDGSETTLIEADAGEEEGVDPAATSSSVIDESSSALSSLASSVPAKVLLLLVSLVPAVYML